MGESGPGVGRSVVRPPGLAAAGPGHAELLPPARDPSRRLPAIVIPWGELLQGAVNPDGMYLTTQSVIGVGVAR
jgi:hypothetical protein